MKRSDKFSLILLAVFCLWICVFATQVVADHIHTVEMAVNASTFSNGASLKYVDGTQGIGLNAGSFSGGYQPGVLGEASLVSYWKMDGDWLDSKDGNNGTAVNGTAFAPPIFGTNSASFDGVNDFIDLTTSSNLKPTTAFTVELIANLTALPGSSGWGLFIGPSQDSVQGSYVLTVIDNRFRGLVDKNGAANFCDVRATSQIVINNETNLALRYDATNLSLFINGAINNSVACTSITYGATAANAMIGRFGNNYFKGRIDEVAIYDSALSNATILAHTQNLNNYDPSGPVATFPCLEFHSAQTMLNNQILLPSTTVAVNTDIQVSMSLNDGAFSSYFNLNGLSGSMPDTTNRLYWPVTGAVSNSASKWCFKTKFNSDGTTYQEHGRPKLGNYTEADLPATGNVLNGIIYGVKNALTGTSHLPSEDKVELGYGFGANGTEFTGSMPSGGSFGDQVF